MSPCCHIYCILTSSFDKWLVVPNELFICYICLLGNTRVITQTALQTFQDEMGKVMRDPYKVQYYITSQYTAWGFSKKASKKAFCIICEMMIMVYYQHTWHKYYNLAFFRLIDLLIWFRLWWNKADYPFHYFMTESKYVTLNLQC